MNDKDRARVNTVPDLADSTFISYAYLKKERLLTFKIESWDCWLISISFKKVSYFVDYFGGGYTCSLWRTERNKDLEYQNALKSISSDGISNFDTLFQFNAYSSENGFEIEDRTYDIAAEEVFGEEYEIDCEPLLSRSLAESSAAYEVEDKLTGLTLAGNELISYERWGYSLTIRFRDEPLNTLREFTFHKAIFFADWGAEKIDALSRAVGTDRVMQAMGRYEDDPPDWRSLTHYRFTGEGGKIGLEVVAAGITSKFVTL